MSKIPVKGKCLCGSVTMTMDLEKTDYDVCHCGMCRKYTGGPLFSIDAGENVTFKGEEFITTYDSSEWAQRGFCKKCGSHIFYRLKKSGFMNFSLGFLEQTDAFHFHMQIFVDHKPAHYEFANETKMMTQEQVFAQYS